MDIKKHYHSYENYCEDVKWLRDEFKTTKNLHLVSIYRGSLGMGAHLSNLLDAPLSIVKFQTYDEKDDKEVTMLHNAEITSEDTLVVLDDIYDTGNTFRKVKEFLSYNFPNTKIICIALHGKPNQDKVLFRNKHPGCWIVYPWENIKGEK